MLAKHTPPVPRHIPPGRITADATTRHRIQTGRIAPITPQPLSRSCPLRRATVPDAPLRRATVPDASASGSPSPSNKKGRHESPFDDSCRPLHFHCKSPPKQPSPPLLRHHGKMEQWVKSFDKRKLWFYDLPRQRRTPNPRGFSPKYPLGCPFSFVLSSGKRVSGGRTTRWASKS